VNEGEIVRAKDGIAKDRGVREYERLRTGIRPNAGGEAHFVETIRSRSGKPRWAGQRIGRSSRLYEMDGAIHVRRAGHVFERAGILDKFKLSGEFRQVAEHLRRELKPASADARSGVAGPSGVHVSRIHSARIQPCRAR